MWAATRGGLTGVTTLRLNHRMAAFIVQLLVAQNPQFLCWQFFTFALETNMPSLQRDDDVPDTKAPKIGPALARGRAYQTGVKDKMKLIIGEKIFQKKNTYHYKDIVYDKEIRLLKILRGKKGEALECVLFSTDKFASDDSERIQYWALSYWWGEGLPHNEIKMFFDTGGRSISQKMTVFNTFGLFYVRDNLAAALHQFRSEDKDVNLWIDAICINQDNLKEKTAQVARMNEIYYGADNVCVWLGAGDDETVETFEFLKALLNLKTLDDLIRNRETPEKWRLVAKLMQNKWFSRRWVIQELALARKATVRWGGEEIQWTDFADITALIMTHHSTIQQMLGHSTTFSSTQDPSSQFSQFGQLDPRALGANTLVNATSDLFRRASNGEIQRRLMSLEVLVSSMFLPFEASDPRDTIYAVLSLAKDTFAGGPIPAAEHSCETTVKERGIFELGKGLIHYCMRFLWKSSVKIDELLEKSNSIDYRVAPDYKKCLTDVCAHFMEYCIETSEPQSLDILCRHWAPKTKVPSPIEKLQKRGVEQQEEKLPSWIPSIEGHAFGGPLGAVQGRKHGDSFVGDPDRQHRRHYNASAGRRPSVIFGKYQTNYLERVTGKQNNLPDENGPDTECHLQESTQTSSLEIPLPRIFDGTLYVKGISLAEIKEVSGRVSHGVIPSEAFEFGGWNNEHPPDEVPDQLWRTLVADRGPNGINAPTWYRRACLECLGCADRLGDLNTRELTNPEKFPSTMISFLERVQRVVFNRRFFKAESKTQKVLYGLSPPTAKAGDKICILFGCSVPVLLRSDLSPTKEPSEFYNFGGECYVHGMMDGEAVTSETQYPYRDSEGFMLR